MNSDRLKPGFLALHGNRVELLFDTVAELIGRYRLAPLEPEVFLVQSNGTGEWLKMALAQRSGICAAVNLQLPGQFQWALYRRVLGPGEVPERSPLDDATLVWRLLRLLTDLHADPDHAQVFAPLASYLSGGDPERCYQLARQIADLYDQYQVHRPDWLENWADGRATLGDASGVQRPFPASQDWQASLWQRVLATLEPEEHALIRPHVHERVIDTLLKSRADDPLVARLPQRVTVFGLSHLAYPTLRLLGALSRHSQVVFAVPNPCRHYWADIIEGHKLLRAARRRHPNRAGLDLSAQALEQLHRYAHPLLAAWGRQSRDFIRLLDEFDDAGQAQARFNLARIDLFDEAEPADGTLLQQVQRHIRELLPVDSHPKQAPLADDRSIVFHIAHSPVRELEVLHDQLLDLLATPTADRPLRPRDVVVMVPDINRFAPAIRAVFGQYADHDPRHIPFDITDLSARGSNPLLAALQWVTRLNESRCTLSELCALFEVPAIAARFEVDPQDVPRLATWMQGAGIRWGLNRAQRSALGLDAAGDMHTALFGLNRMLMGYAVGMRSAGAGQVFRDIEPYGEIGGLDAELVGALASLVESLVRWLQWGCAPTHPAGWAERFRALLADLIKPTGDADRASLDALEFALAQWTDDCAAAAFDTDVPLSVAADAWLDGLDAPLLARRFRGRGITFCTLVPMRAIPFEVVCLLGMNDGDYPRRSHRPDFDLIALPSQRRPGDRARRDDDRQMMLEALLSARRVLYVSWSGRSVRDDTHQPPSVLVSQLRHYLAAGWSPDAVAARTIEHPLQAFSRRYFEAGAPLVTHAGEWRRVHIPATGLETSAHRPRTPEDQRPSAAKVSATQLAKLLANPPRAYFQQQLGIYFDANAQSLPDEEPFTLNALDTYQLIDQVIEHTLTPLRAWSTDALQQVDLSLAIRSQIDRLQRAGALPLGGPGEQESDHLQALVEPMIAAWRSARLSYPNVLHPVTASFNDRGTVIEASLDQRYAGHCADPASVWIRIASGEVLKRSGESQVLPHRLIEVWVQSLLASAAQVEGHALVIARDATLSIRPTDPESARRQLLALLELRAQALTEPLPVAVRTALEYVTALKNPLDAAATAYEGGEFSRGEVDDPFLARCFPDFSSLTSDGRFQTYASTLYAAIPEWIATHVTATQHPAAATSLDDPLPDSGSAHVSGAR